MTDEHIALGIALLNEGKTEEAMLLFRRLSAQREGHARAVFDLALRFHKAGSLVKAIVAYQSLTGTPLSSLAHSNMASALKRLGRMDEALAACVEAVVRTPELAEAYATMGAILQESDHPAAAIDACRRAAVLSPGLHTAYMAMGHALQDLGDHAGCLQALKRSALLEPAKASTRYNLAEALLRNGHPDGWSEYEWRWDVRELGFRRPVSDTPEWAGQDLDGKTLLVCEEQGFGDTLQFIRLVALVRMRCARVIVQCRPPLVRILSGAPGVDEVVTDIADCSGCDYRVSLMSLMHRLGATLDTNPAPVPYLRPPSQLWESGIPASEALKIGLVWAGDPRLGRSADRGMDRRRSLALSQFGPLFRIPRLSWISLQKGTASQQLETAPVGRKLFDPMDGVRDYADTAAIVARLDLVIGVDTSVVHLAGALGTPVWVLSRFDGCWRWLLDREDSPWYPTLRLFRQERPGDWDAVVERVAQELSRVAEGDRLRLLPGVAGHDAGARQAPTPSQSLTGTGS